MHDRIIISDTSSLIALTNIGELEILKHVYKEVIITSEIAKEYGLAPPEWIKTEQVNDKQKELGLLLEKSRHLVNGL